MVNKDEYIGSKLWTCFYWYPLAAGTEFGEFRRSLKTFLFAKGVFIATQLNSTDPVEQRTAKSVVFLFMTSRPTN